MTHHNNNRTKFIIIVITTLLFNCSLLNSMNTQTETIIRGVAYPVTSVLQFDRRKLAQLISNPAKQHLIYAGYNQQELALNRLAYIKLLTYDNERTRKSPQEARNRKLATTFKWDFDISVSLLGGAYKLYKNEDENKKMFFYPLILGMCIGGTYCFLKGLIRLSNNYSAHAIEQKRERRKKVNNDLITFIRDKAKLPVTKVITTDNRVMMRLN